MNLTQKIAAAAGALTLAATGIAAAVEAPDAAQDGLGTAEANAGFAVPVGPTADVEEVDETTTTTEDDALEEDAEVEEVDGEGQPDNHGAYVSSVAQQDYETGRERGEAVSAAAQSDIGKPSPGADDDDLEEESDDVDDDTDDVEDDTDDDEESAPTQP